ETGTISMMNVMTVQGNVGVGDGGVVAGDQENSVRQAVGAMAAPETMPEPESERGTISRMNVMNVQWNVGGGDGGVVEGDKEYSVGGAVGAMESLDTRRSSVLETGTISMMNVMTVQGNVGVGDGGVVAGDQENSVRQAVGAM